MGFSKKGLKRKMKSEKVGAKTKEKRKLGKQIENRKQHLASKREAAEATEKSKSGSLPKGSSVDELFASLGGDDLEEDDLVAKGAGEEEDDSDSDAGAFQDVDGGDDLAMEDLEGLDEGQGLGTSEAQRHEDELRAIKERDPEFYKFLVEQDKQLLDFRADELRGEEEEEQAEGEEEKDEDFAAVQAGQEDQAGRLLTLERFKQIEASAQTSFTAFKAALNAFHAAVRSIQGAPEAEGAADLEEAAGAQPGDSEAQHLRSKLAQKNKKKADKERNRSAASLKRKQRSTMTIDSEATFSEVLEWCIANVPSLLRHYAGEEGDKKGKKGKNQKAEKKDEGSEELFDATKFLRWRRVKVMANIFWDEALFLLNHLQAPEMLEFVLRNCSRPDSLCWLWPFKHLRKRYLRRCCSLWARLDGTQASQPVRLLAFLFIRNSAAMALQARFGEKDKDGAPQLEVLVRTVLRAFAEAASQGYSWRSLSSFRFMENCILELFRIEDATAYRVGYVCIRQLALILRNACVAASQGGSAQRKGGKEKQKSFKGKGASKKKSNSQMKQIEALVSWPFVRAMYLWTKAVSSITVLKPLAYPLSMIMLGAVKSRLTSLQHFPFVFHGLTCLNRLAHSLEAFVPVSAHLLKAMQVVMQAFDKEQKLRSKHSRAEASGQKKGEEGWDGEDGPKKGVSVAKAPDVEVLLHFQQSQTVETLTLEVVGSSLCALFIDHLGFLSRSVAFPELAAPLLLHLRRHSKHCKSETLRRQMKSLLTSLEQSADAVRRQREMLQEPPPAGKLLVLDLEATPLGKQRLQLLKRRAQEERQNVEAELRDTPQTYKEKKKEKRRADRHKVGSTKAQGSPEQRGEKAKKAKKAGAIARAAGAARHDDVLEEMGFSSGDE
mmetsp:Transcript_85117/g.150540  ORF Transcript_85117/g.150540 Transcript_85117/m.150540 type:complete len:889 (-) Transcript_85117:61-2727(-)